MPSSPPFTEVLALGATTRRLRAGAVAGLWLLCCGALLALGRLQPPVHAPIRELPVTVTLEKLPPPPPPAPAPPAPRAPAPAHVEHVAPKVERAPEPSDDVEVPDPDPAEVDSSVPTFHSLTGAGVPGGIGGPGVTGGELYGTATSGPPRHSRARPARAVSYGWICKWPNSKYDSAWVSLRVLVSETGQALNVETFDATAPEFAQMARRCAQDQTFIPPLDEQGHVVRGYTSVIKVYFMH